MRIRALVVLVWLAMLAPLLGAAPLDVHITGVHVTSVNATNVNTPAPVVTTTLELRDVVPDRFKKSLDDGAVLHLRVQTELWESRPVWDRLVYPAIVRAFRLRREPASRDVSITDDSGASPMANPLPIVVDLGSSSRVGVSQQYYVHVIATLGTLADREADELGDAIFGRPSETNGLGSLSRLVFRTALQVSDYLQSVTTEAKSRRVSGRDVLQR